LPKKRKELKTKIKKIFYPLKREKNINNSFFAAFAKRDIMLSKVVI